MTIVETNNSSLSYVSILNAKKSSLYCFVCSCFRCWFVRLVIFSCFFCSFICSIFRSFIFVRLISSLLLCYIVRPSVHSFVRPFVFLFVCSLIWSSITLFYRSTAYRFAFVVRSFGRSLIYSSIQPDRWLCLYHNFFAVVNQLINFSFN